MKTNIFKILILLSVILLVGTVLLKSPRISRTILVQEQVTPTPNPDAPLFLKTLMNRDYPAGDIKIEETLKPGINYKRYIASYLSDGLKIYGLYTVPNSARPEKGFPAIVFLHGYLDPKTYSTTARYVAYQDGFAKNGFVTFKPDLRGHGKSEGQPVNSNFSEGYVIDTLNLVSALKMDAKVNPGLIGMWGHSNGGGITLRILEVSKAIKAAVIWAGVVGSYEDLLVTYRAKIPWISKDPGDFIQKYGPPNLSSPFWSEVDPYAFIQNISAPVELHHGTADTSVPVEIPRHFLSVLKQNEKTVELFEYQGGDHNIAAPNFSVAMERSVAFFKRYLSNR